MSLSIIYKYHLQPHLNSRTLIMNTLWMMPNLMKAKVQKNLYQLNLMECNQQNKVVLLEKVALLNKTNHALLSFKY